MATGLSAEFIEDLKNTQTPLENIFTSPHFHVALKLADQNLISYLKAHTLDILACLCEDPPSETSNIVFKTLVAADSKILRIFCKNEQFNNKVYSMITDSTLSESILIRLLRIIAQFFFKAVRFLPSNYTLIDALVQNVEKPVVLNLLDSLISAEKTNTNSIIYLHKENLHKKIYQSLGELVELPSDSNHPFLFGPIDSKRYAFYQLITKMARSATLGQIYRHEKFLDVIFRQPDNLPNYIKNYKWYAICSTYKPNMIQNALPIIEKSIEIVQSIYLSDRFHSYFAYAFSFFNQNLQAFPKIVLSQIENPDLFLEQIMNGVQKFPDCTNMHFHFRKFYEIMLNFKRYSILLVKNYVPIFIDMSYFQKNRILATSFNELLIKTIEMAKSKPYLKEELRKIPEFPVYATTKLREYKNAISDNYGEEPPSKIYQFIAKFFE